MAELRIHDDEVQVRLSSLQELGAVRRSFAVPRSAVAGVEVVDEPFERVRGIRAPGTGWPKTIALGTWRGRGTKDFLSIHRDERAVLIELDGQEYDRLLIGCDDPEDVAARLG